ncbi:hypothetical protein [Phytohabitans houttuyneae]|uniref:hypothetical protein n=1 Tax=Phytohabitans houttuyneae TaxID=1076126 RepID=UPI0015652A16|nr:hypothetical protein [Phytohabitans houttuyneae]
MKTILLAVPVSSGPANLAALDRLSGDLRSNGLSVVVHRRGTRSDLNGGDQTKAPTEMIIEFVIGYAAGRGLDWTVAYLRERVAKHRIRDAQIETREDEGEDEDGSK